MPSNDRVRRVVILVTGIAFYFWVLSFGPDQTWAVMLVGYVLIVVLAYVRQAIAVRRMVRALRRLDPAFRRAAVNSIDVDFIRDYYDQRLRAEGDADITGFVERYPFAASETREQTRWYWSIIGVAALTLASQIVWPHASVWQRAIAFAVVLVCVILLAIIRERFRRLDTVLEVSPYGLAEVHPDGTRRLLPFNQRLVCRVNRWRGRVDVIPLDGRRRDRIALDFDRVGFNRLVMCVLVMGGFMRPQVHAPVSDAPELPSRRVAIPVPWQFPTIASDGLARLWPLMFSLAFVPLMLRLAAQLQPRFEPLNVAAPLPANALALDSLIAKKTTFSYPGEYIVRAAGDTVWIALAGRADSATVLEVHYPDHKERLWVTRETHRLTQRVILQP